MISPACPECTAFYANLGRKDGGCQPGCPKAIRAEPLAAPAPRQQQAVQQAAQQIQHEGQSTRDTDQFGIEEDHTFGRSQKMTWTRRVP